MGKTKITVIDDSFLVEKKQTKPRKKVNPSPEELEAAKKEVDPKEQLAINQPKDDQPSVKKTDNRKKPQKPGKKTEQSPHPKGVKIRSKKYQKALEKVDRNKNYPLEEAIDLARETSYSKYDGTLEIHISTNVKNLRGLVLLPFASGKKMTILAFPSTALRTGPSSALRTGLVKTLADEGVIIGDDEKIEQISKSKIAFDVLITTPEWMPKLAKLAKILGPRGLMPNPKNGTITNDLKKAVTEFQSGKIEYKTEKEAPVIHLGLGKVKQVNSELIANFKALLGAVGKTKVKKITLSPSLGPGIKVDLGDI